MAVENVSIRLSGDATKIDAVLDRLEAKIKRLSSKEVKLSAKGSTKAIDDATKKMAALKSKNIDVNVSAKGFDKIEQTQRRLATAQSRLQDQIAKGASSTTISSSVTQIGALQNRLNSLKAADISSPFSKLSSVIDSLTGKMDGLANKILKIGAGFAATGVALGVALGKSALGDAADLEATMGQLQAMLGATDKGMAGLDKRAVDLGNDLKLPGVSAGDAAMAMKEMAANGLSLKDSMDGARSVLELAKVANLDYAESARIVATQLNTFGLSGDKASEVSNKLAKVSGASGVKIDEMAIAASQAGLVAKSSGMSFNQMADALGLLARNGLRGSDAGTSLKTALIRLSAPTAEVAKEIKRYGLEFRDANGNMKDFRGISEELQGKLKGLSKAQQDAAMASIFGTDAIRVGNIMMEQGSAGYDEFTKRVQGAGDASAQLAGKTKGLQGVIEAIKSTWDTGMLTIGKSLSPVFTEIAKKISDFASKVDFKAVGDKMAGFVRSIMTEVSKIDWKVVMDKAVSAFKSFIEMAKILGTVTKTAAKIIGGGDMAVGLGRISAAALFAGPLIKALSIGFSGLSLALKAIGWKKEIQEATSMGTALGGVSTAASVATKALGFIGAAIAAWQIGSFVGKELRSMHDNVFNAGKAAEDYKNKLSTLSLSAEASATAFSNMASAISQTGAALDSISDASVAVSQAQLAYNEAVKQYGGSSAEAAAAQDRLLAAQGRQISQSSQLRNSFVELGKSLKSVYLSDKNEPIKLIEPAQLDEAKRSIEQANIELQRLKIKPAVELGISEEEKQKMVKAIELGIKEAQAVVDRTELKAVITSDTTDVQTKIKEIEAIASKIKGLPVNIKTSQDFYKVLGDLQKAGYVVDGLTAEKSIKLADNLDQTTGRVQALQQGILSLTSTQSTLNVNTTNLEAAKFTMDQVQAKINEIPEYKDIKLDVTNPEATLTTLNNIGLLADTATRERIINILTQSGAAKSDIDSIIAKIGLVPKQTNTDVNVNTSNAEAKISSLIASLRRVSSAAVAAAAKAIGFSNGGIVPEYRSAGGIINKPEYYAKGTSFVNWKPRGTDIVPAMLGKGEGVLQKPAVGIIGRSPFNKLNSSSRGSILAGAKEIVAKLGGSSTQTNNNSQADNRVTNNSIKQEFNFNSSNNSGDSNSLWRARNILGSVI